VLELEVTYLEQYLLSLYRKAFDQQISSVSPNAKDHHIFSASIANTDQKVSSAAPTRKDQRLRSPPVTPRRLFVDKDAAETATKAENPTDKSAPKSQSCTVEEPNEFMGGGRVLDSTVHRCHSSLSYRATVATRPSPNTLSEALRVCHSQPLSMTEVVLASFYFCCCLEYSVPSPFEEN